MCKKRGDVPYALRFKAASPGERPGKGTSPHERGDIAGPRGASSRPIWETLEGMVREKAQEFIQQIMEEEVTELLATVCELKL